MMKKMAYFLVAGVLMLTLARTPVHAIQDYGTFTYWYSDSSSIGYLTNYSNNVGVGKTSSCGMTDSNVLAYSSHSLSAWPLVGYAFNMVTGQTNYNAAPLKILCISRTEANGLGIPSNALGANAVLNTTLVGTGNNGTKNVYSIPNYQTYLIWDTCSSCMGKSDNLTNVQWQAVAVHEHGHGIGYYGHNASDASQVMYPAALTCNCNLPQTKDKNHMRSMYTIN